MRKPSKTFRKATLSSLVQRAQRMYMLLMGGIILCLGILYLFMLNGVTMSGYVLTKETQAQYYLLEEMQLLDSQFARKESREYISESSNDKTMIVRDNVSYVTIQPTFTAKK